MNFNGSGDSTNRVIFENVGKTCVSLLQKSTNAKDAEASRTAQIFYKPTLQSIQIALELSAYPKSSVDDSRAQISEFQEKQRRKGAYTLIFSYPNAFDSDKTRTDFGKDTVLARYSDISMVTEVYCNYELLILPYSSRFYSPSLNR